MDTLALLCNLHADGPATLQRLRRVGCESLAALRRLAPATLSEQLDWNERAAARFLREAALLCERIEHDEAGGAELEDPEFELESELVEQLDGELDEAERESEDPAAFQGEEGEDEEADEAGYAPPAERVEAVLGTWRELDRLSPPEDPASFVIPRPPPLPDRALAAARLAELPARLVARLEALGVRTLRELVDARELELARTLPLAFTRVKHLQFQAARALEQLGSVAPAASVPLPPVRYEAFTPPPVEPFETAGPFA